MLYVLASTDDGCYLMTLCSENLSDAFCAILFTENISRHFGLQRRADDRRFPLIRRSNLQKPLTFSDHARLRMAQRNLSKQDVLYIVQHAKQYRQAGVVHYFLRKKDIPENDASNDAITKLEGATVLVAPSEYQMKVVTVYRNKKGKSAYSPQSQIQLSSNGFVVR